MRNDNLAMMLDDFGYLERFPSLQTLKIVYVAIDQRFPSNANMTNVVMGVNLQHSAVTHLTIASKYHTIRGFRDVDFGRKLKTLLLKCPVQLSHASPTPLHLPVLEKLRIGTINMEDISVSPPGAPEVFMNSHFRSFIGTTWFSNITTLRRLNLRHMLYGRDTTSILPAVLAPNAVQLSMRYCNLSDFDAEPTFFPSTLQRLKLSNVNRHDPALLVETLLAPCRSSLTHLSLSNDFFSTTTQTSPQYNQVLTSFVPPSVAFDTRFTALTVLSIYNVPLESVVLRSIGGAAFPNLNTIAFSNANVVHIETGANSIGDMFPVLSHVDVSYGADTYFPLWVLGLPNLRTYNGTHTLDANQASNGEIDIDGILPERWSAIAMGIAVAVNRHNTSDLQLTSHRMELGDFSDSDSENGDDSDDGSEWGVDLAVVAEQERVMRLENDTALQGDWQMYLDQHTLTPDEMPFHRWHRLQEQQRTQSNKVQIGARSDPYCTRYDPASHSTCNVPDPFAPLGRLVAERSSGLGVERQFCPICHQAFSRLTHDADAAPIVDNDFLNHRAELELDIQASDRAPDDAEFDTTARLGCVVACNMLPSDFDANGLAVQPGETHADAVRHFQCDHAKHLMHRVCFATTLFDVASSSYKYKCPIVSNAVFHPTQRDRDNAAYAQQQEARVLDEVHMDLDLDAL